MPTPLDRRSSRSAALARPNPLRALTAVIDAVDGGINLGQGVCDLDPPVSLVEGAVEAIAGGVERQVYTPYSGLPELRSEIAGHLGRRHGQQVEADQVCVALGSSGAFFAAGSVLLEPGDEVILFEPYYSYHRSALALLGAEVVGVPLGRGSDGLVLDLEGLRAALGPRTKGLVLNTPANPSGKVFTEAELRALGEVLRGTDVLVFTDEVYDQMLFDGRRHVPPSMVEGLGERCVTLGSFSKTYSMTGWRIGYAVAPAETADAIGRACDQMHVCAPRPMQRGVERALRELPDSFYSDLSADYERRRDKLCAALERNGFGVLRPEGAYYVMADYREVLGADLAPYDAVLKLIDRARINGVPGDVFFLDGSKERSIRFHFAVEDDRLDEVCRRLDAL